MGWKLLYNPQVIKQIKHLVPKDQRRIIAKIEQLAKNPQDPALNIKPLINTQQSFRLRVGKLRILLEKESRAKIIYIWKVSFRGSAY